MAIIVASRSSPSSRSSKKGDGDMIRNKLLYKLGIYDFAGDNNPSTPPSSCDPLKTSLGSSDRFSGFEHRSPIQQQSIHKQYATLNQPLARQFSQSFSPDASYSIPIKFGIDADYRSPPPQSFVFPEPPATINALNPVTPRTKKSVKFNNAVSVRPIPSHHSYSPRVHLRLYTPSKETIVSAGRNAFEFNYEGCDWRTVVENDGMYVCSVSGELVHPAHVVHAHQVDVQVINPDSGRIDGGQQKKNVVGSMKSEQKDEVQFGDF